MNTRGEMLPLYPPMAFKQKQESAGIIKSVAAAYLILLLHILLIAGLGILVLFFSGIVNYMLWILLAGGLLITLSGYLFYRKLKKEGRSLGETLRSPDFGGRSVEISFMGGMATVKLGKSEKPAPAITYSGNDDILQIEQKPASQASELANLAQLFENELITLDEFNTAKRKLFDSE